MTGGRVGSGLILPLWEEVLWPFLDAWDSVSVYAQFLRSGTSQGRTGRTASSSSSF